MGDLDENFYLKCLELEYLVENDQKMLTDEMNRRANELQNQMVTIEQQLEAMELRKNKSHQVQAQQFYNACVDTVGSNRKQVKVQEIQQWQYSNANAINYNSEHAFEQTVKIQPIQVQERQTTQLTAFDHSSSSEQDLVHPVQLFVSGLKSRVGEEALRDYFSKWGKVTDIFIPIANQIPRPFGYVSFGEIYGKHPCDKTHPHIINGCFLHVDNNEFSPKSDEKSSVIMVNGPIQKLPTQALKTHFSKYGKIIEIIRKKNPKAEGFLRFAFIQFDSTDAVDEIVKKNLHLINGVMVSIRKARNFDTHRLAVSPAQQPSPPSKSLFIDNDQVLLKYRVVFLENALTTEDFKEYFSKYGRLIDTYIPTKYGTNESKHYGYIILGIGKHNEILRYGIHTIKDNDVRVELDSPSKNVLKSKCIIASASPKIISKISEADLKGYFKKFGKVTEVRKPLDPRMKSTSHYAFVEFHSEEIVENVIQRPVHVIKNLPIGVAKARKPQQKS